MAEESSSSSGSGSDSAYIELQREVNTYDVAGRPQAWRMRVTVLSTGGGIDKNIFMYLAAGIDPVTNEASAIFQCVASPVDIEEFPVGDPIPDSSPAFFRLDYVDILSRNMDLLDETWRFILQDRDELVRTYQRISDANMLIAEVNR